MHTYAAVDLGASSGRVMVGRVGPGSLDLTEAHRFPNRPVRVPEGLRWDILALYAGVLDGLRAAGRVDSVGIDSWAVDHGLLDADGALLGNPVHYRDARTEGIAEQVWANVPAAELYAATGLQYAPFNTLYQLTAARSSAQLAHAERLLLVPDLLTYWLTGEAGTELTNASTTQLIDPRTRDWSYDIARRLGIDLGLFAPLRRPGDPAGVLRPEVLAETGLTGPVPVTTVGSHDTASAVAAVPAVRERFAYICTGTWSLAGLELDAPVLTEASRLANFTNELGLDDTVRYLRNIMGLWLLQECVREWGDPDLPQLLSAAAEQPPLRSVVDAGDAAFLAPGRMPQRIADACRASDQPVPDSPAGITRCILDSLALAHRRAVAEAQSLADHPVDVVHIVGGGTRNALLCQLTADACGLPVVAGPAEAAALGNVLVQARAGGLVGDRAAMRELVARTQPLARYEPRGDPARWQAAEARLTGR
ncbi:carbohydrate kinase [Streptomyces avermitilis]|uniref:Carbohydrate kinase n=1 Tax=Streptomyces avermitilis TaxID=33903 RepID=A0A4D4M7E0_STRAX|nr:rhamnulokinase family protein [Streptomyces avermitilis]KUN50145.1 carbohydrate kinase [Streptomyces avermitilis]OOV26100.1 rhamnulokinase [Streptomyces avermitilis]BBJ55771.1 carbohydrate kinase [Streptomyces avermitilis]GDY67724.1 carbohydrate kinase [Streptomyces avermitilis]GDY81127.1 carbohydrate kinase [Streptomyces avermitilis]